MKTIPLNKGSLQLPEVWEDLTFKQKLFAFGRLKEVYENRLSPAVFRIKVLGNITGYKPKADVFSWILKSLLFYMAIPFVSLYYVVRLGRIRFSGYWSVWVSHHRPQRYDRNTINFNLYLLSELIDFAFTIDDRVITWKRCFAKNPIPYIKIKDRKFIGKKFVLNIAPFTNITAREFSDCFDLYSGYLSTDDELNKDLLLNKIVSILYPASKVYSENIVSDHVELIKTIAPELKFGILFWFSGIVEYYMTHPYYSILFRPGINENDDDKINLGMNGVVLMVKNKGFSENDNINDFFDTQLKILKDDLSEALSKGAKIEELASRTGLNISDINRLT